MTTDIEQTRKLRDALDRIHAIVANDIEPILTDEQRNGGEKKYGRTPYAWFLHGLFALGYDDLRYLEREETFARLAAERKQK